MARLDTVLVLCYLAPFAFAGLNDECNPNDAATCDLKYSICEARGDSYKCVCQSKYTPDDTLTSCVGAVSHKCVDGGDSCHSIPYAWCEGSDGDYTCRCHSGYEASSDRTVCLVPNMMDRCVEHAQCAKFHLQAECRNERCQCPTNTVASNQNNKCIPVLGESEECEEVGQCPENAKCAQKVCQCANDNFVAVPTANGQRACLKVASVVGDACESDEQCAAKLGPAGSAVCGANSLKCRCTDDFVESTDKTTCLKRAGEGGSCFQDQQCPDVCNYPVCGAAARRAHSA